ncbi:hypothetical protein BaRGS_00008302 [Batillaria attramentaria]|uniref:N-acetyltransferase domain-containing protein n=1 Tax=Batillaria attramentaria TaxID=370345 RepID=A0ABD0LLS4_9CAEN
MSVLPKKLPTTQRVEVYPDDEELCQATLEDREAVMGIDRNVYQGEDYLQTLYADHVTGPGMTGYLYKKQGNVVGFLSVQLIDGGQTLLTCAGRIAAEYRDGGMYGRFTRRVFHEYRNFPGVRHVVMTVNDLNMAAIGQKLLKTYRIVMETVCRENIAALVFFQCVNRKRAVFLC